VTPTEAVRNEVSVRRAVAEDGPRLAALYTAARAHAVPQMPPARHTAEEDVAFYSRRLSDDGVTAWIAEADGELLGFALCTPTFLDGLYVRPDLKGQGIGSLLLDVVGATHPDVVWSRSSAPTARATRRRRRTSGWPGVPESPLDLSR
jgi:GNAT superfamily N-acetyltransferase